MDSPQWGHIKPLMFSINPKTGMLTVLQKLMDFLMSAREISWGVVTMMAFAPGMV
jgi:hypothetical protein